MHQYKKQVAICFSIGRSIHKSPIPMQCNYFWYHIFRGRGLFVVDFPSKLHNNPSYCTMKTPEHWCASRVVPLSFFLTKDVKWCHAVTSHDVILIYYSGPHEFLLMNFGFVPDRPTNGQKATLIKRPWMELIGILTTRCNWITDRLFRRCKSTRALVVR